MHDTLFNCLRTNSIFGLSVHSSRHDVENVVGVLSLRDNVALRVKHAQVDGALLTFDHAEQLLAFSIDFARIPSDAVDWRIAGHVLSLDGLRFRTSVEVIEERLSEETIGFERHEQGKKWDDLCIMHTTSSGARIESWYSDVLAGLWQVHLGQARTSRSG